MPTLQRLQSRGMKFDFPNFVVLFSERWQRIKRKIEVISSLFETNYAIWLHTLGLFFHKKVTYILGYSLVLLSVWYVLTTKTDHLLPILPKKWTYLKLANYLNWLVLTNKFIVTYQRKQFRLLLLSIKLRYLPPKAPLNKVCNETCEVLAGGFVGDVIHALRLHVFSVNLY